MSSTKSKGARVALAGILGTALAAAPIITTPALAQVSTSGVFINELHYDNVSGDTGEAVEIAAAPGTDLAGWKIEFYNGNGGAGYDSIELDGIVGASSTIAVDAVGLQNGSPDGIALVDASGALVEFLSYEGTFTAVGGAADGIVSTDIGVVEGGGTDVGFSLQRTGTGDTGEDFTWTGPAENTFGSLNVGQTFDGNSGPAPEEPGTIETVTIAEIQGDGDASPISGDTVTTTGIVTASYPTGGFDGYYIQTPGTGGSAEATSHAVFVYSEETVGSVGIGDYVEVTGEVDEYFGLTQLVVDSADDLQELNEDAVAGIAPTPAQLPADEAGREALEGMLVQPQGDYTVSNTYITNQYAEIGLAAGTSPLITPTEIARPGTAEYDAAVADNAARAVGLDDGASIDFLRGDNMDIPLPYLTTSGPITVGAPVTFTSPVIFDFRFDAWKFQPTTQLTVENAPLVQPAEFGEVREAAPEHVGGDLQLGSFNVLNYFSTTGDELTGCEYYEDRDGNPITVRGGCLARGAADDVNLARQQGKIVNAINTLGAELVALEEIENSAAFGKDRDAALAHLVDALNAGLGAERWAFVPSPADVPENEDVIRTAFIYQPAAVEPVGESSILLGSPAFGNAREPLAQVFAPVGAGKDATFLAIVNHFKSKGSGSGDDADQGDGQGGSNASRVAQATALVEFADALQEDAGTDKVFLMGDFNAYTQEDPMQVFYDAGYIDQGAKTGEYTYSFSGQSGSLDHILASPAADQTVTGADIWNINSGESVALEYSRYNYNATDFSDESVFRSSDHDPILVGIGLPKSPSELDKSAKGKLEVTGTRLPGGELTIDVGAANDGATVSVWLFSPAQQLGGWQQVAPDGTVAVTLPADARPANYRVAVFDADGNLLGWTTLKVTPPGKR